MAYVTQKEIETAIPAPHLVAALDDDRDGRADDTILADIIASASQAVDAFAAPVYPVPFADPAPAMVREAAFIFACERIYDRRQIVESNPFKARADRWREDLALVGKGKLSIDAATATALSANAGSKTPIAGRI